jgi:hypothetical protein
VILGKDITAPTQPSRKAMVKTLKFVSIWPMVGLSSEWYQLSG